MMRAPRAAILKPLAAARAASTLPVPTFAPVKFQKEDVDKVMGELPAFNFYEMKEAVPNPYQNSTLDRSILLDAPKPVLAAPKTEFSQLENGLKVVSIDKSGLTARLGLYVNAGSRFENASNFGVSHMVSMMAYSSTAHLSHLRTVKTLEQLGANATADCKAGREEVAYSVDVAREFVPLVVPLMVGNVLFPRLLPWEVKALTKKVKEGQDALAKDPDAMLSELLHRAAYCNNTLGLSPYASERCLSYFKPETIRSFFLDHFAPERMVLVGVNVAHSELAKWAMRSFADYNAIPMKKRDQPKAAYTGGDLRLEGSSPFCHVALALESAAWGTKELAATTVLQAVLGGGSATNSSPGSGLTSRLATQVLRQNPHVESVAAFSTAYSDSGLFGVYGVCAPNKAGDMCTAIAKSLAGLPKVGADELARAKAMVKGKLLRDLDDDSVLLQDIASQVLHTGRYGSASDLCKAIDGISEADVSAAATKMLSSKPTIAAFGDTHTVPHYSAVEGVLRAGRVAAPSAASDKA